MIDINNVGDAITILIKNDSIFEQLKTDFPEILADLTTFKTNPNCSCRGRVFKFFSDKVTQEPGSLDKYVKDAGALTAELIKIQNERMLNNYSGKILVIDKTEQAWAQFASTVLTKSFRGFSVVERDNSIAIYFI